MRKRLYLRPDEDADLINWLEQQGNISEAIRKAIRFYLAHQDTEDAPILDTASVPDKILERVLKEREALLQDALRDREKSLRRIIREELQRLDVDVPTDAPGEDVDPDAGERLDDMF